MHILCPIWQHGLIFPNYISDSLRTTVFIDAGNAYTTMNNRAFGGRSSSSGPIRFGTGLEADFMSPLGPIQITLSKALNAGRAEERVLDFDLLQVIFARE